MAKTALIDRLNAGTFFVDGAMGTQLMLAGGDGGGCDDYLNIASPEVVGGVHEKYIRAGSDAVLTNTFGANSYALSRHGHADKAAEINTAAAQIARQAAGNDGYVLGDIGPCGDFVEPLGGVMIDDLQAAFADQAKSLLQGGVDGFIIETMTAIDEIVVAAKAVRSVSDLPVFASMSFDPAGEDFRTMMGVAPADMVAQLAELGVTAIGYNCGTLSMEGYVKLTEVFADALKGADILLIAQPNAGKPELIDGDAVYSLSAEDFASAAMNIRDAGARIMGGCCGTSPAHIEAMIGLLR